uniref:Uncharacterized protein n=1 Tax=Oryza barthii TaxID=65489 RepID=A0A0D3H8W4_9ORYZ
MAAFKLEPCRPGLAKQPHGSRTSLEEYVKGKKEGKLGNAFSSKHDAESAQSSDELEELESKTPSSFEPPRNILLSLRSASAKQTKPTLPRRSARLVPKRVLCFSMASEDIVMRAAGQLMPSS